MFTAPHKLNGRQWQGMRVGLLGGSFNPAHEGHIHISTIAKRTLNLDAVWWLVSPQNPLKQPYKTTNVQRAAQAHALKKPPYIIVSHFESEAGTNRTFYTIKALHTYFPHTQFVWICGSDIAAEFHRWHQWRNIPSKIALAVIARPPATQLVRKTKLFMMPLKRHIAPLQKKPALKPNTLFVMLENKQNSLSSTILRNS